MLNEIDRASAALEVIPNDLPGEDWLRVSMATKSAGVDFETWHSWCKGASNYRGENDCRARWKSIDATGPIQAGTLYKTAAEYGWRIGASPRPAPAKAKPTAKPANSVNAEAVWGRCLPATSQHPYIVGKGAAGVPLDGLRVLPDGDPLRIMGESMAGALVAPVMRPDGTLATLQLIPTPEVAARLKAAGKPGKLNLPGCPVQGWFTVGQIKPGEPLYIVEGLGTAWAVWQATGAAAVVAFGWGNVGKVAGALRHQDNAARLVLCPDTGKETDAHKIAADIGCAVATMPEGWPANSDINDLFNSPDGGFDVVQALLESATETPKAEPLLKPVSVFDVMSNPSEPPRFVWDGYLPRGNVALLGAHGGTGKSTIALMLAVCAVLGRPMFGVDTEACPVLFVSLEDGSNVVRHRLASICKAWLIDPEQLRDRLHIVDGTEHPELFTAETRGAGEKTASYFELRKIVQSENIGLVMVDNASDAFGGDEIQRRQVRAFMRTLAEVARLTDSAVMLLAHVDKNTSRNKRAEGGEGYSGSTAWHNSARSRLFLTRGDDGLLTLEHQKSNLGKKREPLTLNWLEGGFPQLIESGGFDGSRQQGRADDDRAAALLRLIAEFESRGQYCSPLPQARNNVYAMLRSEPQFQALKLNSDSTKRILNQCQRAKWLEPLDYRSIDRKPRQRWTVTPDGRDFAGLPAPTAPTYHESAQGYEGAPTAPTYTGGVGDRARTNEGAHDCAEVEVLA